MIQLGGLGAIMARSIRTRGEDGRLVIVYESIHSKGAPTYDDPNTTFQHAGELRLRDGTPVNQDGASFVIVGTNERLRPE